MVYEKQIQQYRLLYAKFLQLYPKQYYERFGKSMEQTFSDLLWERAKKEKALFSYTLWMFIDTSVGIIKENITTNIMKNKRFIAIITIIICILLVPLIAMQFSSEVNWTVSDFIFAGGLLLLTGLSYEVAARKSGSTSYRAAVGIAAVSALLLLWINGAVGIIGNENNPLNALYFLVVGVGVIGAFVSLFKAKKMALAMFVTAAAQTLVPVAALIIGKPNINSAEGFIGVVAVFVLSWFFSVLFAASGFLFLRAASK